MKKFQPTMVTLIVLLAAAMVLTLTGCPADEPEVIDATFEALPEAAEEVYTDEPEQPGTEELPGIEVEEMVDDTPPHVEDEPDTDGELDQN